MKRTTNWAPIIAGLTLAVPIAQVARSETYLTEQQAATVLFPGIKLNPRFIDLTDSQCKKIENASGEKVRDPHLQVWWGKKGQALFIDKVIGKHEFITYAVAIVASGALKGIEIMDYRETYGSEVRRPEWRRQFIGKTARDPLKLDHDIKNISGATLSSAHVTAGVRRILSTYDLLRHQR